MIGYFWITLFRAVDRQGGTPACDGNIDCRCEDTENHAQATLSLKTDEDSGSSLYFCQTVSMTHMIIRTLCTYDWQLRRDVKAPRRRSSVKRMQNGDVETSARNEHTVGTYGGD